MLYFIASPLGNLEDISLRQARVLSQVDVILAEDTRSVQKLLQAYPDLFDITPLSEQKIISYYIEKEFEKLPFVLEMLKAGKSMAVISEAGMPVISDPGLLLVQQAIKQQIEFTVVPGPSAVTTGLLYSGFNPQNFMFLGFLPKKRNELKKVIERTREVKRAFPEAVFVCFESPHRIQETLTIFSEFLPTVQLCLAREMTKKFEEIIRGTASEILQKNRELKGEITLIFD